MRTCFHLLLAGSFAVIMGCGNGIETTTVSGRVTIGGKRANCGAITFAGPQNYVASGYIQPDGTYEIGNAPVGGVKVTITPAQPKVAAEPGTDPTKRLTAPPAKPIPARYASPNNDLAFTVMPGMTKNFDLQP
jgi:hypothetical protein